MDEIERECAVEARLIERTKQLFKGVSREKISFMSLFDWTFALLLHPHFPQKFSSGPK